MDERRRHAPAPDRLEQIPEHVRKWLNSIDEDDIKRFQRWNSFTQWAESTGRYGKIVIYTLLAIFGFFITVSQTWEAVAKFWRS